MRLVPPACVIGLGLLVACAGGDGEPNIRALCEKACGIGATLDCPGPLGTLQACTDNCVRNYRSAPDDCRSDWADYVACAGRHASPDWTCYDQGLPDLSQGVCEPEGLAASSCLYGLTEPDARAPGDSP